MRVLKGEVYKNFENDSYEVCRVKSEMDVSVRFLETDYECRAREHLVVSGNVRDFTKIEEERNSWEPYHEEFTTNSGDKFVSILRKGRKIKIEFESTGYFTEVYLENARQGKVKDPFSISVYGQGYMGLPDKSLPYWKPALQLWQNMMKRCYSEKDERGYLGRCQVDSRWKCFENFLTDLKGLEGFQEWMIGSVNKFYSSNLDKDFYKSGNEIYSRHYCRFLPEGYNKSLGKKNKTLKDWA